MPKYSDTSYLATGEISQEMIDPAGVDEVMLCPPDVDDRVSEVFQALAQEGKGRYRWEDVPAILELASLTVELRFWDAQRLAQIDNPTGNTTTFDKIIARTDKLSRRATVLRDKLGCTPAARFSVASRRRGSATYKSNGAARTVDQAEQQAIAVLEERKVDRKA